MGKRRRCSEACTSVDRTKIGNRGHYSFSKGERVRECHSAPGGMFSDGYDVMRVEYGWWLSRGSSYDKESVHQIKIHRHLTHPLIYNLLHRLIFEFGMLLFLLVFYVNMVLLLSMTPVLFQYK